MPVAESCPSRARSDGQPEYLAVTCGPAKMAATCGGAGRAALADDLLSSRSRVRVALGALCGNAVCPPGRRSGNELVFHVLASDTTGGPPWRVLFEE
jgi:hypothetical protein